MTVTDAPVRPIAVGLTPSRPNRGNPVRTPTAIDVVFGRHRRCSGEGHCPLPTEHNLVAEIQRLRDRSS